MTNKEKVKQFWENNKVKIIYGIGLFICGYGGYSLGKLKFKGSPVHNSYWDATDCIEIARDFLHKEADKSNHTKYVLLELSNKESAIFIERQ